MKTWKPFNGECDRCGSDDINVLTDAPEGSAYDGDDVECADCGLTGSVIVFNENEDGVTGVCIDWEQD